MRRPARAPRPPRVWGALARVVRGSVNKGGNRQYEHGIVREMGHGTGEP